MNTNHLRALKDGWYEENSKAITEAAIETANNMCAVPMFDGGIQLELHAGGMDVEIVIGPDGRVEDVGVSRSHDNKDGERQ
jgi:hypothetical protein